MIDAPFIKRKGKEGKERLEDCHEELAHLQNAGEKQMELGLLILEFAKDACPLLS